MVAFLTGTSQEPWKSLLTDIDADDGNCSVMA
jgi:hypothetical protein